MNSTLTMEQVNIETLFSQANESAYSLFINGLFSDEFGEMKFYHNGTAYRATYDGHEGWGNTPAAALKDLLQTVVNGLYFAENGRPQPVCRPTTTGLQHTTR